MLYLRQLALPGGSAESNFFWSKEELKRTCYSNFYPFQIFPGKKLTTLTFEPVTIFCGGNGSGKTTLLNILADLAGAERTAPYNHSSFWKDYLALCQAAFTPDWAGKAFIITSDDVFDYLLNIRALNEGIDRKREDLLQEFLSIKYGGGKFRMRSMDDYDQIKKQALAYRSTGSRYVKDQLMGNVRNGSNGESAFEYFTHAIGEDALYLLDEPENSLSPANQLKLAQFIEDSARFFHCQFILSTHSPLLLALKGAKVYDLDRTPPAPVRWTELETVQVYRQFFESHRDEF